MSSWTLLQIVLDIFLSAGVFLILMRLARAPKDDPRLSRGLQLLQSKISVLEDLSDRTEVQVGQLTAILEQKAREVQAKVQLAEQHVQAIRVSMDRSLDVAKIFQDKIPHQEIIERQNTIKYVQAARLAHQGANADEIASRVDLPKGEIEFIAKVNRERLMFNEEQLPWWAKSNGHSEPTGGTESAAAFFPDGADDQKSPSVERIRERNFAGASAFPQMSAKEFLRENENQNDEPLLIFPQSMRGQTFAAPQSVFSEGVETRAYNVTMPAAMASPATSSVASLAVSLAESLAAEPDAAPHQNSYNFDSSSPNGSTPPKWDGAQEGSSPSLTPVFTNEEENARRLRAEVDLAEHQRLVENLSRLQFEMQNLDIQLAKENSSRNLAHAFESQIPPSTSLQRLGEEFRKVCSEAKQSESQPALERATPQAPPPVAPTIARDGVDEQRDPVLARAVAQAKVQSALRLGAKSMAKTQAQLQTSDQVLAAETGRENKVDLLEAARQLAGRLASHPADGFPQDSSLAATEAAVLVADSIALTPSFYGENVNRVINGRGKDQPAPVIKKIEFPRIN